MRRAAFVLAWALFSAALFSILEFQPLRVSVRMWNGLERAGSAQLFWKSRNDRLFTERASIRFPTLPGSGEYRLSVPSDAEDLRLDPLESPGQVAITRIQLRNALGLPVICWPAGQGLREWTPNEQLLASAGEQGGWLYSSTGTDPFLTYDRWPDFVWARKRCINLACAMSLGVLVTFVARWLLVKSVQSAAPPRPARAFSRGRAMTLGALAVSLSLAVSTGLGEALFRIHARQTYRTQLRQVRGLYEPLPAALRAYEFRPSMRGATHTFGSGDRAFSFHLNSLGFRGPEWAEKSTAAQRVLVLGDSYAFGWAVEDGDTFPAQAEGLFRGSGTSVEVLNAGIPGYSTPEELGTLRELATRFRPDSVVLTVVMNDARPPQTIPTPPDVTYRYATLWSLAELKALANLLYRPTRPVFRSSKYAAGASYLDDFSEGSPGWRATKEALAGISTFCAVRQIHLSIAILPDFSKSFDPSYPFLPIHGEIRRWARELSVPADDLWEAFRGSDAGRYRVAWEDHPNRAAHGVIAQVLFRRLSESLRTSVTAAEAAARTSRPTPGGRASAAGSRPPGPATRTARRLVERP